MDTTTRRGKPGPPHRGPRKAALIRMPEAHYAVYLAEGERLGYKCFGDYLNAALAQAHGLPVPDFAKPSHSQTSTQEELPQAG